jgi:hypothetical protein
MTIYHSMAPTWHALFKSMEVMLRYQVPSFNKTLFEVLESLLYNRVPTNTSVKPIPHMLDGVKVENHCWPFHLLKVQFSQNSSGDVHYMSPGIVMHDYEFRANNVCSNQHMLYQYLLGVLHSGKITTDDYKIRTAINTDATPHHHRTLPESVAFLDNIWHVLLTMASPHTLMLTYQILQNTFP